MKIAISVLFFLSGFFLAGCESPGERAGKEVCACFAGMEWDNPGQGPDCFNLYFKKLYDLPNKKEGMVFFEKYLQCPNGPHQRMLQDARRRDEAMKGAAP